MIFEKDILKNRVVVTMGQSPKSEFYNKEGIGIPFLQGNRTFGEKYPYIDTYCSEPKRIAQTGDVLMSVRAPVGDVNIATEEICIGRGLCSLRMKNGNNEYLYYLLKSFNKYIVNQESGTVFGSINKKQIENLELPFPNDNEQKRISDLLSTLDNKIYLNTKITQTLEKIAQLIFKHWFIDFEFPNENGEPYKSSGGKFKESEIGMIPVNWKLRSLDEIANYQNGLAMQKYRPENDEKSLPVVKIKELNKGFTDETSDRCRNDIDEKVIINDGDVIFSWSGTLLVKIWLGGKAGLNQHLFKVTSKKYPKWFYYYWTKHHLPEFIRIAEDKTTTMGHIKRTHLKEAKVVLPDDSLLNKFTLTFEPLVEKIIQLGIENRTLIYLRDSLLPKLMSGEIRIPEAEQEVEACLQKNS